jgi:hypothetical protein
MAREDMTWFTRRRWLVLDLASRKGLYRTGAKYFEAGSTLGLAPHAITTTARELTARGLAASLESDMMARPIRLTKYGKRLRSQWFRLEGRATPFPFPGLLDPPRHTESSHLVLMWIARAVELPRSSRSVVETLETFQLVSAGDAGPPTLTESGAALLGAWATRVCKCDRERVD